MSDTPPQNLEAEENVLGAIMSMGKVTPEILELLQPKNFYRESHATIYQAMLGLQMQAKPVSGISVADELDKTGKLETIGGSSRVAELLALTPATANAPHYAGIVRDMSALRELIAAGQKIEKLGRDRPGEISDLLREAEQILHAASDKTTTLSALPISEGLDDLLDEIRHAFRTKTPITGLLTGFTGLDHILHGFWPSQLIILAARTGQGKSTLAQNIAENIADLNTAALFISLEMSRPELQIRSLARAGRIDGDRLSTGQITLEEAQRLPGAIAVVKERGEKFLIQDSGVATPEMLGTLIRRHNDIHPLGVVIVDYLGLMTAEGKSNYERISHISRSLKLLAQNMKVPVLALCQMNRKQDERTDKEPMLSDLRDSGSLEQDSDVVLFLHRESDHDVTKEDDGSVKLIVAKNRRGKSGFTSLNWNKAASRFLTPHTPGDTSA